MHEIKVSLLRLAGRDVYYMQYRHPETGRKVKKSTGCTLKRDAERVAGKWEDDLRSGRDNRLGRMEWAEFRQRYEDEVASGLAVATEKKIAGIFNLVEKIIHPVRLGNITPDALQRMQKALRDAERSESTIKSHMAHLRAALAWSVDMGFLAAVPKFPKVQRAKQTRVMKGRPITTEEFERMLAKVEAGLLMPNEPRRDRKRKPRSDKAKEARLTKRQEAIAAAAESWRHLLRGLWWSGLRLGEALELHWTDTSRLHVDLSCRHPMLRIPAELEKGHKDRLLPIVPEFAQFLAETPSEQRHGYVFNPRPIRADKAGCRLGKQQVERVIGGIGKAASVKVSEKTKAGRLAVKFASAHDLRRSFGERWASRVMPQVLMELMRHESIDTTLRYYVGRNAQQTASVLWEAAKQAVGANLGATPHHETSANSPQVVVR